MQPGTMQREDHERPQHQHHQPTEQAWSSKLRLRPQAGRRTHPIAWFLAACCTLLWIVVVLGGIAVLVVYLVFRPRSPRLQMSSVTLNAAYLDESTLLNADVTILANFTNPNHKVDVSFSYLQLDLYFNHTMIATQAVDGFAERPGESTLRSVHMVSSQVALPQEKAEAWNNAVAANSIPMVVEGSFRTRSAFGGLLHFTYWLRAHCSVAVYPPPNGVLLSSNCTIKRTG